MTLDQRFWYFLQLVECFYKGEDSLTLCRSVTVRHNLVHSYQTGPINLKSSKTLSKDTVAGSDVVSRKADDGAVEQAGDTRVNYLRKIAIEIARCKACQLCERRANTVPGEGSGRPLVMIVGEGPGRDEDESGRPFVGMAGQYLDRWLSAVDLDRKKNCFITNVVKCRPPNNRDPLPDEIDACLPFLKRQIELLRPNVLLSLGRVASQVLTGEKKSIGALRGHVFRYEISELPDGIPLVPTYHPSGVLRNKSLRRAVWDDLRLLKQLFTNSNANG